MLIEGPLTGRHVVLEPLTLDHAAGLAAASGGERASFEWTSVPDGREAVERYIEDSLALAAVGEHIPFAVRRRADDTLIGSTRYLTIEYWSGPAAEAAPDSVEIGATWYAPSAQGTAVNPEAKLLLLTHAFDVWRVGRVQFKTDARNARSRAAIEKLGARFEGVLRNFQPGMGASGSARRARDSAMYSIIADEWPACRARLESRLTAFLPN